MSNITVSPSAGSTPFDNSTSTLTDENIQDAIVSISGRVEFINAVLDDLVVKTDETVSILSKEIAEVSTGSGGGTTINTISQQVDFGTGKDFVSVTVSAAWVTPTTVITLTVTPNSADHDIEDALLEEMHCNYGNIVNGVGFDIYVFAPNETHGRYIIKGLGV